MKKLIGTIFVLCLISGCGNEAQVNDQLNPELESTLILENETHHLDSISGVIESSSIEIQQSTDELNDIINEL